MVVVIDISSNAMFRPVVHSVEFFLLGVLLILLPTNCARAQSADKLSAIEDRMRTHIAAVRSRVDAKESEVKGMLDSERRKWDNGKSYKVGKRSIKGPEEHPWIKANPDSGANPNSKQDYRQDSLNVWDGKVYETETWSCFQPQLIAKGSCEAPPIAAAYDLGTACQVHCCMDEWLPFVDIIPNPPSAEKFEVLQFWFPEHQVAVNNYARSRLNPTDFGGRGRAYTRSALLRQKRSFPEKIIKNAVGDNYRLPISKLKEPNRDDPFIGQQQWGGSSSDHTDQLSGHVYRTKIAAQLGDKAPKSPLGWSLVHDSIFDALAPSTDKKPHLNLWTEYGSFGALSSVDSLSFLIPDPRVQKIMQALLGQAGNQSQRARENPAFYQQQGAATYRQARWPAEFGAMKDVADINPRANPVLREVVYKGPVELMPLSLTQQGLGVPEMSTRAIFARRSLEMSGMKALAPQMLEGEASRSNTYTISNDDKAREVDKMQLVYPLLRGTGKVSECFRSQKIPSMLDQTENAWVARSLPMDHMRDVKQDNSDSVFAYWNKRVACTCKIDTIMGFASQAMNAVPDGLGPGRGDGDRTYGKIEPKLCEYKENRPPSAWVGKQRPDCLEEGSNSKTYEGIQDNV